MSSYQPKRNQHDRLHPLAQALTRLAHRAGAYQGNRKGFTVMFGARHSLAREIEAHRKQKDAYRQTMELLNSAPRQEVKPAWFDPKRSDFWNDPNRWDGIDDPHTEIFWMKRRVDRIDCPAVNSTVHPKKRDIEIISANAWLQRGLRNGKGKA